MQFTDAPWRPADFGFTVFRQITGDTSIVPGDKGSFLYCTSSPLTITFPSPASLGAGFTVEIFNNTNGAVTLIVGGGITFERAFNSSTSLNLLPRESLTIVSAPAIPAWDIIAGAGVQQIPARFINPIIPLVDAATITTDISKGNVFSVTLGGNRTLGAISNPFTGNLYDGEVTWLITQDGAGNRTLAYDSSFHFSTSVPSPTLSVGAGKMDIIKGFYISAPGTVYVTLVSLGYTP